MEEDDVHEEGEKYKWRHTNEDNYETEENIFHCEVIPAFAFVVLRLKNNVSG